MKLSLLKRRKPVLLRLARAAFGPFAAAWRSGYIRSALKGYAVDRAGEPVPMYTYPVVDLLKASSGYFSDKTILEFGGGQSTRWWARHARQVVTVEYNEQFAAFLQRELADASNVRIVIGDAFRDLGDLRVDVASIDGYPRIEAARFLLDRMAPDGVIIVDNSDVQAIAEIPEMLQEAGYFRVDFYGLSPAAFYEQCTSIFCREPAMFTARRRVSPASKRSLTEELS